MMQICHVSNYSPSDHKIFVAPVTADLTNLVETVKAKWRQIGKGLGMTMADLDGFQAETSKKPNAAQQRMRLVFQKWLDAKTSDCTWEHLCNVLMSPTVAENRLALELYQFL